MDTGQLVNKIKVESIQLYRWKYALRTFDQFLLIHTMSNASTKLQVLELQYEETALGHTPFILINKTHYVPPERFGVLCLTFNNTRGQQEYFNGRAILQVTTNLTDYQLLQDASGASKYWLIFSPLKKLRQFMRYRKAVERLQRRHIYQDQDHTDRFVQELIKFEPFMKSDNLFTRLVISACVAYFESRDSHYSNLFLNNSEVIKFKEEEVIHGAHLKNLELMYFDLKQKQMLKQEDKQNEKLMETYKTKNALALTILGFVLIWVPIILSNK